MRMIDPVAITDAVITAASVAENDTDDAPVWAAGSILLGQRVRRATTHRVYECMSAHTAADAPADYPENNTAGATPKWAVVRPTNKYAPFDSTMSTQAFCADALTYTFQPVERVDAMGLYNMDGITANVTVTVGGVERYNKTFDLRVKKSRGWYEFFSKPIRLRRNASFGDLPPYRNATISVTIAKPGSVAKVGDIQIGRATFIGEALFGVNIGGEDFSTVDVNKFGTRTFTPRRSADAIDVDVFVENEDVDLVKDLLKTNKSRAVGVLGNDNYDALNIFAFVQDYRLVLDSQAGSYLAIKLQELT